MYCAAFPQHDVILVLMAAILFTANGFKFYWCHYFKLIKSIQKLLISRGCYIFKQVNSHPHDSFKSNGPFFCSFGDKSNNYISYIFYTLCIRIYWYRFMHIILTVNYTMNVYRVEAFLIQKVTWMVVDVRYISKGVNQSHLGCYLNIIKVHCLSKEIVLIYSRYILSIRSICLLVYMTLYCFLVLIWSFPHPHCEARRSTTISVSSKSFTIPLNMQVKLRLTA